MSTRRVVGGHFDGSFKFRTSLFGYDARYDDPTDPTKISFNSDWDDVVYVEKVGYVDPPTTWPSTGRDALGSSGGAWLIDVAHGLGYRPYVEARPVYDGGIIYDDFRTYTSATNTVNFERSRHMCGEKARSFSSLVKISSFEKTVYTATGTDARDTIVETHYGHRVAYVIYRLPIE